MTREEIEAATRKEFPIGCRVVKTGRWVKTQVGTVTGYSRGGGAVEDVPDTFCCVQVLWDGNRHSYSVHRSFLQREADCR